MNAEFWLMTIGSVILTISFIFQTSRMYRKKQSQGLSLIAWAQNFLGRTLYVIYAAFMTSLSGLPLMLSQGICAVFTIPMLYYIIRNSKNDGIYAKRDFRKWLFAARVLLATFEISLIIVFTLVSRHVIKASISDEGMLALSILCGTIASTSFIPQAFSVFRSKNTKSISLMLTICFQVGNWLLVSSLLVTGIEGDITKYIFPILMASLGNIAMLLVMIVKIENIIKKRKKQVFHRHKHSVKFSGMKG